MTLLVARQCRLLGAPRGAVGALRRLQRAATPAVARASRAYAHEASAPKPQSDTVNRRLDLTEYRKRHGLSQFPTTPRYEDSHVVPVRNSAILIPASVPATEPEAFVEKMEPVAAELLSRQNLVVFLVTPSFAPWLLDDRVFLEKALARLYKHLDQPEPIVHAICAVVDKVPAAEPLAQDMAVIDQVKERTRNPPVNETGHEGIAYVTLPAKAEMSAQPKFGDLGCIDFFAHTSTTKEGRHNDRVRVPLANTVFQTGEVSTMINSTWEWSPDQGGLKIRKRKQHKTAVINLSKEDVSKINDASVARLPESYIPQDVPTLSIPLIPLTFPRQVDGHMGNIIRGVIGPDGNKMTASTELEQVVPQYFKSRGEPAQATSAWALVIPKSNAHGALISTEALLRQASHKEHTNPRRKSEVEKHWQTFWQRDPPLWNDNIQKELASGARLHKVLSGGGGWGKKAGLLSLDPVPFGAPTKKLSQDKGTDTFDSVDEYSTALNPVVEDGDSIQFFISPAVNQEEGPSAFEQLKMLAESTGGSAWSWEFGVVPSTIDSVPGGSWQHKAGDSEVLAFRGSFGALTEGGLTLMRGLKADQKTGLAQTTGTTMIDVPFSRWSAVRMFPKKGAETWLCGPLRYTVGRGSEKKAKANRVNTSNINPDAGNPS